MKKIYIVPQIETVYYEPVVLQSATYVDGTITGGNDDGSNGEIGYGDDGTGITPDAKASSIWDDWSAEGEEEE